MVSEQRKEQLREAQKRLREKQKKAGIVDRTFKVSQEDIKNAEKIKQEKKLRSLDAAISLALKEMADKL